MGFCKGRLNGLQAFLGIVCCLDRVLITVSPDDSGSDAAAKDVGGGASHVQDWINGEDEQQARFRKADHRQARSQDDQRATRYPAVPLLITSSVNSTMIWWENVISMLYAWAMNITMKDWYIIEPSRLNE